MHLHITTLVKSFFTFGTAKWFLSCVGHFILIQMSTFFKKKVLSHLEQADGRIWRCMKVPTLERSHLPISSVTMLLLTQLDWRCMKWHIQERSHLHVPNVIRLFKKVLIWMSMKGPTQERNHLPVPNVKKLWTKVAIWRCNKAFINTGSLNLKTYPCKQCEKMFGWSFFMKNPKWLKKTHILAMSVTRNLGYLFSWKNPHSWETPSLQRVWQEVWVIFLIIKHTLWCKSISLQLSGFSQPLLVCSWNYPKN